MPRQDRLFDLFAQHAKTVVGAADTLQFVSASLIPSAIRAMTLKRRWASSTFAIFARIVGG
nr:hypothetical protein KS05_25575 [Rhizobium brockwellii]